MGLINLEALAFTAYFLRDLFAAPLRYYLEAYGLGFLWFGVDFLGFLCLLLFFYRYVVVAKSIVAKAFTAYVPFSLLIAYIFLETISGVFSSFKMIFPIFVGFCFCQRSMADYRATLWLVKIMFYVSLFGVVLASFIAFPWVGLSFETFGGFVREAGRLRWAAGELRVAGFANDSAIAGFCILITFVLTSLRKSVVWCAIWGLVSLYVIHLTTSKTALGTMVIYLLALLFVRSFRTPTDAAVLKLLAVWSFICSLIPPFLMIALSGVNLMGVNKMLFSIHDRINNSWQNPFIYMADLMPTGFLSGCGLGCFNYPQYGFSPDKAPYFVPVDNFYIGTLLMIGPVFLIFVFLVIQSMRWNDDPYKLAIVFVMNIFTVTVLFYSPASGLMMIGIGFSEVFAPGRSTALLRPAKWKHEDLYGVYARRRSSSCSSNLAPSG